MLRGILSDRYRRDKIPDSVDTVVIGSGMSGLSCAAVLSRMGQRVLVLEQHYVAGGGSHMFQLKGGLRFDSGLHYLVPYSGLLMWLATGGDEMPLRFERMGSPMAPSTALRSETSRPSRSSTTRRTCPTCMLAFLTDVRTSMNTFASPSKC